MVPINEQEMTMTAMRTEEQVYLYCSDTTWITKMEKLLKANPDQFSVHSEDQFGKTYKFPKRFISIRSKDIKREISEEKKEQLRERMMNLQKKSQD